MAKNDKNSEDNFLGGAGLKFNTAGHNAPLKGEKVAETPPPPPFGGPRVWAGAAAVIIAMGILWYICVQQAPKPHGASARTGVSAQSPSLNPDSNSNQ